MAGRMVQPEICAGTFYRYRRLMYQAGRAEKPKPSQSDRKMNELNQVQSEIVTADLLFARIMHDYNYQASKQSQGSRERPWWGPRLEAIPSTLLLRCFGALDEASVDLSRIIASSRQARH